MQREDICPLACITKGKANMYMGSDRRTARGQLIDATRSQLKFTALRSSLKGKPKWLRDY